MARTILSTLTASASLALFFGLVFCEEEKDLKEGVELPEMEVLAPPILEEIKVSRHGEQITILTQDQIERLNAQDLASALRRAPGVNISRHNIIGSYGGAEGGAIYIRGQGSVRPGADIQTLVDGIPKFVGVWTHPLLDTLSIDPAERIEIYKGAEPVFLGNMTFGAINIVTRRRWEPGFETLFSAGGGTHKTWMERFEHGGKTGQFDYYIIESIRGSGGHRPHSDGRVEAYFARMGYALSNTFDLGLTFSRTKSWARDPGRKHQPTPVRGKFQIDDYTPVISLSNHSSLLHGHIKAYYDGGHIDWEQFDDSVPEPFDSVTDYSNYGLRVMQTLNCWPEGELVLGLDSDTFGGRFVEERPSGDRMDSQNEHFRITAPYTALSHLFGKQDGLHLIPSAGVRYHHHSDFDDQWTPQAGIVAGWDKTQLHARHAKGINYPGIYAVFQTENQWNGGDRWKSLEPEKVDHFEAGLSHRPADWLLVQATAFWDKGKDRLVAVFSPPPPPRFENIPDFETRGIEATATLTPSENLTGFIGATFLTDRDPERLPNAPGTTFSAGVTYRFMERWRLDLDAEYVSHQYKINPRFGGNLEKVDEYFLLNGRVAYDFECKNLCMKEGTVYLAVENITDSEYEYRKAYPMPGIMVMAGFDIRF